MFPFVVADFKEAYAKTGYGVCRGKDYERTVKGWKVCPLVVLALTKLSLTMETLLLQHKYFQTRRVLEITRNQELGFLEGFDDVAYKFYDKDPEINRDSPEYQEAYIIGTDLYDSFKEEGLL